MRPMRLGWIIFFVSAGVLGFELSLMRVLLVASWHHFAFLVISIALLGFGASGTALSILRNRLLPRADVALFILVLATALAMPVCLGVAQHVPVEARIIPSLMWRQIGYWAVYWALLGVPFFLGAGAIGLSLMIAGRNVPRVYAANLLGSAAGLMFATTAMSCVPPRWLSLWMGGLVLVGVVVAAGGLGIARFRRRLGACGVCAAIVAAQCLFDPPHVRVDPYKYGAYVHRLARQGTVQRVAALHGPRGVVEAYHGGSFHDLPFLSVGAEPVLSEALPPPMSVLVVDGHLAGSVLDISRPDGAEVMDRTLMSFPYMLLEERESARVNSRGSEGGLGVLLLGETGGTNVWLAARHGASRIHVVQPDDNIVSLLRGPLHSHGGAVLDLPTVSVTVAQPRHFVEQTPERFDLIQLVSLESSAAGSGGVGGLAEDHLITVEGIASCLKRLTDDGMLAATRGIQTPPRDNLKLFATFAAALRRIGVAEPERHVVIVRDFLAVCTIVKRSTWTSDQIERVRRVCADRQFTPVWFPGIRPDELNQPDAMTGPPGEEGDWLHHAAGQLFSSSGEQFIRSWPFNIRPPVDNSPFFLDFCRLTSIGELKRVFGDLWLTRTELAFLIVLAALVMVGSTGGVLTLVPLLLVRRHGGAAGRRSTLVYFASIGLGYMLMEMTFLSRLIGWVGDPVSAAAVTIAAFLLSSGAGSLTAQRFGSRSAAGRLVPRIVLGIVIVGLVELLVVGELAGLVGPLPYFVRCGLAFCAIIPLGYLMGFPMPAALARLDRGAPATIPWAWGVNGFASVVATPAAVAVGMTWGYSVAGGIALMLYLVPALLFTKLPGGELRMANGEWRMQNSV